MDDLRRQPTRIEQLLTIILSMAAMLVSSLVASFLWVAGNQSSFIAAGLFTTMAIASAVLLFRSAFTTRRILSPFESSTLGWVLVILGTGAIIAALFITHDFKKFGLFGTGLSCLASGLVTKRSRR